MLSVSLRVNAQSTYLGLTYNIGFPMLNTKDFTNKTSLLGFSFEARKAILKSYSLGLSLNWNAFQQDILHPLQRRDLDAWPLLLTTHYYFQGLDKVIPYIGVGLGTSYIRLSAKAEEVDYTVSNWHFGFAPELGFIYGTDFNLGLVFNLKYHFFLESGDVIAQSYFTMNLGVFWTRD